VSNVPGEEDRRHRHRGQVPAVGAEEGEELLHHRERHDVLRSLYRVA